MKTWAWAVWWAAMLSVLFLWSKLTTVLGDVLTPPHNMLMAVQWQIMAGVSAFVLTVFGGAALRLWMTKKFPR